MYIEGTHLTIKAIWQTNRENHTQQQTTEITPSQVRSKINMPTLATFTEHSLRGPSHINHCRKKIKGIHTGKEVKMSLFTGKMILHKENPKDATRKLL